MVWIFSQSTDLLPFIGILNVLIWTISLWFGLGLITNAVKQLGSRFPGHLRVWMFVFILVVMQVSTSLRPIIGTADSQFTAEKKFFMQHWVDAFSVDESDGKDDYNRSRYNNNKER